MDTKIRGKVETMLCDIASATVIEAGDLVAKSGGYIIKATATSTQVARAMQAHASGGGLTIEVTKGRARLLMDASNVFAAAQQGVEYDIAVSGGGKATINSSGTTYKVLMMDLKNQGVVGSASNVNVVINKPIDDVAL